MRRKVVGTIMFATMLAVVGCGAKNESNKEAVSKDAQEYTIDTPSQTEEKSVSETQKTENETEESSVEESSAISSSGIRPEFKEAMDSYEKFFDEYVAFMKKYNEAEDVSAMMLDYADYLTKYAETMEKMSTLGEEELTEEEAIYYAEVTARITKKTLEIVK